MALPASGVLNTVATGTTVLSHTATGVIAAAMSQLRVPYSWGAESPGKGFDCSGLVQWAYQQVGISLPRTSEEQYTATTPVAAGQAKPGDLVFMEFGAQGQSGPGHVGIYLGAGNFIDAPYTGVDVRVDPVPSGATYGRVPGLALNAPGTGTTSTTATPGTTTTTPSNSSNAGCNGKGGGIGLSLPVVGSIGGTIGNACQIKALAGGVLVGLGGLVLLAGAVLIASYGLKNTRVGAAVGKVGGRPLGAVAGLAGAL
jgi:hypothetical protein